MSVPPGTITSMASRLPIIFAIANARLMALVPFSAVTGSNSFDPARSLSVCPPPAFPPDDGHVCRGCANAANAEAGPHRRARRRVTSSPQVPIFVVVAGACDGRLVYPHAAY